jgi:hypothetical protein
MIDLGMNVVKVTAFKRFDFVKSHGGERNTLEVMISP